MCAWYDHGLDTPATSAPSTIIDLYTDITAALKRLEKGAGKKLQFFDKQAETAANFRQKRYEYSKCKYLFLNATELDHFSVANFVFLEEHLTYVLL